MVRILIISLFLSFCIFLGISYSQETGQIHESQPHKHKQYERPGKQIRQTNVKGYNLTYHLLNLSERNEMMKKMDGHSVLGMKKVPDMTNHLMVYVEKSDGKIVPGDVAFLITGPDGKDFRTVTMEMYGGYGADISMKFKGVYTIKTKIIADKEGIRIDDEFTFEMK